MQVITRVSDLLDKIDECNTALTEQSDDAMRRLFGNFRMDLSGELPDDPFSPEYSAVQDRIYQVISGRTYSLANERTPFDPAKFEHRPFPYHLNSTSTAGHHLLAIGFLLCKLQLPAGARVVEFGAGWGNTTMELARSGLDMTAVDIEPGFCELIRRRAAQHALNVTVVEADFFWADTVTEPYDAAIFFECFHHCNDHMRLLRALHRVVKPGGHVYLASEPIFPAYPVPWGVRMDGEALWAMRNFGWLELGFDAAYFHEALARTGWRGTRHVCQDAYWASVWQLQRTDETTLLPSGRHPPIRGAAASWDGSTTVRDALEIPPSALEEPSQPDLAEVERLRRELEALQRSTSWRITGPVRAIGRAIADWRPLGDNTDHD